MRNNKYLYLLFTGILAAVMVACSPKDEPTPVKDIPLIILDTDIGSSTDDLFAMEML